MDVTRTERVWCEGFDQCRLSGIAPKCSGDHTLKWEVEAHYYPGRQPPACSNPSSPDFADSGDPEEVEIVAASCTCDGVELTQEQVQMLLDDKERMDRFCSMAARDHEDMIGEAAIDAFERDRDARAQSWLLSGQDR